MEEKIYLVQLDNDKYGWSFLWNHTIREINKISLKIEIVSMIIPILAISIVEVGLDNLKEIEGIKTIEENSMGYYPAV